LPDGKHSTKGCGQIFIPERLDTKHGFQIPIGKAKIDPDFKFTLDKLIYNE